MKKGIILAFLFPFVLCATSCKKKKETADTLPSVKDPIAMDSPAVVKYVSSILTSQINPDGWNVSRIDWEEGDSDDCTLGNHLYSIDVDLSDPDGTIWERTFFFDNDSLSSLHRSNLNSLPSRHDFNLIDLDIYAKTYAAQIQKAKTLLTEYGRARNRVFLFKSVSSYTISSLDPDAPARFTLRFTDESDEQTNDGSENALVFYELDFLVLNTGEVVVRE